MASTVMIKRFPNLNEFCSNESKDLEVWLKANKYIDYSFLLDESFDVNDCPNIEFVVDGLMANFYEMEEFNQWVGGFVSAMVRPLDAKGIIDSGVTRHMDTALKFFQYKNIDQKVRGRIIVWEITHMMCIVSEHLYPNITDGRYAVSRKSIVRSMLKFYRRSSCDK